MLLLLKVLWEIREGLGFGELEDPNTGRAGNRSRSDINLGNDPELRWSTAYWEMGCFDQRRLGRRERGLGRGTEVNGEQTPGASAAAKGYISRRRLDVDSLWASATVAFAQAALPAVVHSQRWRDWGGSATATTWQPPLRRPGWPA